MNMTSNKLMTKENRTRALIRISRELEYIYSKTKSECRWQRVYMAGAIGDIKLAIKEDSMVGKNNA